MDINFQTFLKELSKDYAGETAKWMRMLLFGILSIGELDGEEGKSTFDLFNKLTSHGFISKNNVTLLLDIAEVTNQASAIYRINKYKNTIQSTDASGATLSAYRKALFQALTNVGKDDLNAVISFYQLSKFRFDNIWDVVYHIEKEGLLDSKGDYDTFAKHLNNVAQSCLKETPYQTPSSKPTSSLVQYGVLTVDEPKQLNGFSICGKKMEDFRRKPKELMEERHSLMEEIIEEAKERMEEGRRKYEEFENRRRMNEGYNVLQLDEFVEIKMCMAEWYDKRNYTDQLRVLYKDKIPSVRALREANGTKELFTQLENRGHLSATNTKILVDTINVTGTHGVLGVSKHLKGTYDKADHRVTSFSSYRQSLMQFGNSLSESDVTKLSPLLNGSRNEWTVILDLEESGILNEDELQQFIKHLKENGIRGGAKTLERIWRKTNHPTKC